MVDMGSHMLTSPSPSSPSSSWVCCSHRLNGSCIQVVDVAAFGQISLRHFWASVDSGFWVDAKYSFQLISDQSSSQKLPNLWIRDDKITGCSTEILAASSSVASQSDNFIQTLKETGISWGKNQLVWSDSKKERLQLPNTNLKHNATTCYNLV